MKSSIFSFGSLATLASGHAIFQELSVNGASQGTLTGIRAPSSNNPIQDVSSAGLGCNINIEHKDSTIITVPAGAELGAYWGHVIGGEQFPDDPDHPIAGSHKGPIIVYLAQVDDAATTDPAGLEWFKIAESGLNNGQWAVDTMIANDGWHYFTLPTCIAPGQYLMRVELIALHSASLEGEAQFYMECAQIDVTGSGTSLGENHVSFPGAYSAQDPGILVSIYDNTGTPNNGGQPYEIPGPAVLSC